MTRERRLRQFWLLFPLLATAPCLPASEEEEEILLAPPAATARNSYFEVVADDMLSARYAAALGEMLATRFSRMLAPPGRSLQPVLVDLVPEERFGQSAPFFSRIYHSGQVNVSLSWGQGTTRATLERALAQGHLTNLSGAYAGGAVTVPLWLELAVQHLARVQAVPAHGHFLAKEAAKGKPLRLERILSAERAEGMDEELGPSAYWLLIFLEKEERGRDQLRNFLIRLLRDEAPRAALKAAFGEHIRSLEEAELWWMVGLSDLVRPSASPILSVAESRRRVRELSRFAFEATEGESRLFVEDLWEHRSSASLRDELRRRRRVATLEISTVHPFYHNVLLSLDRAFAAVLRGDQEEYDEAVLAWNHDLRAGDELAADTSSVLDDLGVELTR